MIKKCKYCKKYVWPLSFDPRIYIDEILLQIPHSVGHIGCYEDGAPE